MWCGAQGAGWLRARDPGPDSCGSGTRGPAPPRSSLGLESPAPPDPRCWAFLPGLVPSGLLMDGTAPESSLGDQGNDSLTREGHPQRHGGGYAADPSTPSTPRSQPGLFSSPRMKRNQPTGLPVWPMPTWAPAWTGVNGRGEASFGGVEPQGPPTLRPTLSLVCVGPSRALRRRSWPSAGLQVPAEGCVSFLWLQGVAIGGQCMNE